MRRLTSTVAALAVIFGSRSADAFCRTTTTLIPAGYDPITSGCIITGVPLAWHTSEVTYSVGQNASRQVSLADATRIADLAFAAWNTVSCPGGGVPTIYAFNVGPSAWVPDGGSSCHTERCLTMAHDVIVFDDDAWPYADTANTLALTTVSFGVNDGAIFEAFTEVNTANYTITIQDPPPANSSSYDLQSILTHEVGHFLGLAHAPDPSSMMYAFYKSGDIQLTSDDVAGFCTIYPPLVNPLTAGSPSVSCDASGNLASGSALASAEVGSLVAVLATLRFRRRKRLRSE
jgi:hypothetical protein